jgi:hypothetical protein
MNDNPLSKYFRAPGVTVKLPSAGNFQPQGNVRFTPNGDVPVLPMRGGDEILMKSPDALMSGQAIEDCIRSCVPNISNPQLLPTPDVDSLLLAIRAATYGDSMEIECECPHCKTENAYGFSISMLLDTAQPLASEYPVRLSPEVVVYLKPFDLVTSTQIGNVTFQEARKMQLMEQSNASEDEKQKELTQSFKVISHMNTKSIVNSIMVVVVPEGQVTDKNHIYQFMNNIPADWTKRIEEQMKIINETGIQKKQTVACSKCQAEFETNIEFDPSNFFE